MINATSPYNMYESPYQNNSKMRNFSSTKPTNSSIFVAKPVESVQKTIETSVDTFVKKVDEEKEKKSNKKAIAAGSAALVATGLVAILNPKFSTKFISKLKTMSQNAGIKFEKNKENYLTSKFHKMSKTY